MVHNIPHFLYIIFPKEHPTFTPTPSQLPDLNAVTPTAWHAQQVELNHSDANQLQV